MSLGSPLPSRGAPVGAQKPAVEASDEALGHSSIEERDKEIIRLRKEGYLLGEVSKRAHVPTSVDGVVAGFDPFA
jgi:hypothetical protein